MRQPFIRKTAPVCAVLAAILGLHLEAAQLQPVKQLKLPVLAYEKYKLPNGLEVILYENHRLPLVAIDLWYHVGPMNEKAGRTGFAHLFEHMMFEGSEHVGEKAHIRYLEGAGATDINGTTDFDRTNYFETLPSNQLELGLWLESDRMGFLLETLDQAKLANQRDVVRNERRQSVEGRPYALSEEKMFHLLFPKDHPYYADVIGSHADIEAARIRDVRDFFQHYYCPNNATIAIAGDLDPVKIKPLIEKYFGPIPAGPPVEKVKLTTRSITTELRAVVPDSVQLPRVSMGWLTPPALQPGDADADLAIQILGGGRSSRLYRKLVYQDQIAQSVNCENESLALASVAVCNVTARPGVKPEQLETAMNKEIDDLRANGPTVPEVDRARNVLLTRKIAGLQRLGGFGGVADMLNYYNQYVGDPGCLPKDIERYQNATAVSVHQAMQRFFAPNQRAVVYTVPGKKVIEDVPRTPATVDADVKLTNPYSAGFETAQEWRKTVPAAGAPPKLHLPVPAMFTLGNGMKVYLVEDHALPLIHAEVLDLAGSEANPSGKPGTAGFTARMLTQGTTQRSATQIAEEAERIGAELRANATDDAAAAGMGALSTNTDEVFKLVSDVVEHPAFQDSEIERIRRERLAALVQEADQPVQALLRVGEKTLYGEGPYAYPSTGTTEAVKTMTRQDLVNFWTAHYAPQNAALVLAGDLTAPEARRLAETYFGSWSASGEVAPARIPQTPDAPQRRIVIVDKPGAPQTTLAAFGVGLSRKTPDYVPVELMNSILGGLFSSRINMNLREKNGFTYGAFSRYLFRRGAGPFLAGAQVRTDVTGPAARELFAELNRIRTDPPTAAELKLAQDYALRSLPGQFETLRASSDLIGDLFVYDLPVDYYRKLPEQYSSVALAAIRKAALKYVQPSNLVLIAVGDRAKIEGPLQALNLGPVELRDANGDPVESPQ
ncbi:MAG TPA: pitrilysin family protein [Bryobacteraceae bacterium]|nr:pitrilysin family protein [Bryobacteraceae bacterium]